MFIIIIKMKFIFIAIRLRVYLNKIKKTNKIIKLIKKMTDNTKTENSRANDFCDSLSGKITDLVKENLENSGKKNFSEKDKKLLKKKLAEKFYPFIYQHIMYKKNIERSVFKAAMDILPEFFDQKIIYTFSPFLQERIEAYLQEIYNL